MIYPLAFGCLSVFTGSFLSLTSEYFCSRVLVIVAFVSLATAFTICLLNKKKAYAYTVLFCAVILCLSLIYTNAYSDKRNDFINRFYGSKITVAGKIEKITPDYFVTVDKLNNEKSGFFYKIMIPSQNNINCKEGDYIKFSGKLYSFDKAAYYGGYNAQGYYFSDNVLGYIYPSSYEISEGRQTAVMKIRSYIKGNIDKNYSGEYAAMLKAVLVGDKSDMTSSLKDNLMSSGLSHVAVVSGMHISIIISTIGMCFGFIKRKRFIFLLIMFLVFGIIVGVIGGHPSVIRAVIMAAYCLVASTLKKRYDPFTALMFSAGIMTIYNPFCVVSAGFLLSFGATFALIMGGKRSGRNLLYVTVSVFIVTLPICLFYFNRSTLAMFFTNLLISPIMTAMLPIGYLMQGLPFLSYIQDILIYLCMLVIKTFASIKIFNITTAVPTVHMLAAIYTAVSAFFSLTLYNKMRLTAFLAAVSLILFSASVMYPTMQNNGVTLFNNNENVVHIITENGKNILITSDADAVKYYIKDNNLKLINALVLTKFTDTIDTDSVGKVYMPRVADGKLTTDVSVRYYEDERFGLDGVVITPVSYLPYKSKVDDKKAVLLIKTKDKSILFEPYKDDELNKIYLKDIPADIVVLKYQSQSFKNIKTAVGSGLQADENMIYYDLTERGSVTFYKNKVKVLR